MQRPTHCLAPRDILFGPFVKRFLDDGNKYDPNNQTRFTDDEKDELKKHHAQAALTSEKINTFCKNAYSNHKGETAFRKYIGVSDTEENVRKHFNLRCIQMASRCLALNRLVDLII